MLKIGLSPRLYKEIGNYQLVDCRPKETMTVTFFLKSEAYPWLNYSSRVIRPYFVNDAKEALEVIQRYEELNSQRE